MNCHKTLCTLSPYLLLEDEGSFYFAEKACTKIKKGEKTMSKWQEQARKYLAMLIIFVMAISWLPTYGYAADGEMNETEEIAEGQQNNEESVDQASSEELQAKVKKSVQDTVQFYKGNLPTYKEGQIGTHSDFWVYSALWSAGVKDFKSDLNWTENGDPWADFTFWSQGKTVPSKDPNENAGIIIGSKLLGLDPNSFGEQNAIDDLLALQGDNGMFSTIWGEAWALIALDLVDAEYDQQKQIDSMLNAQSANGVFGDTDATGWTLLAFAPHMDQPLVKEAIDKAVEYIHEEYMANDDYPGMFGPNANTTASVVMGLAAVGEDLYSDKWNKPSGSLVEDLMEYQQDDGSFWWQKGNAGAYLMATEQALLALATVEAGQSTFQQMKHSLVETPEEKPEEEKPVVNKEALSNMIDEVEQIDLSKLTDQSEKDLKSALEEARKVLGNEEATQEEVDEAIQLLEEVRDNLKERAPPVNVQVRVETHEKTLVKPFELEVEPFDLKDYINNQNNGQSVVHEETRAIHAIIRALKTVDGLDLKDDDQFGLGSSGNYIEKIGKDGEFTSGQLSGWMYFVNNKFAPVGVGDFKLKDGDSIVMYYVQNFTDSTFSWFDQESYSVQTGEQLDIKLNGDKSTKNAHLLIDEKAYKQDDELVLIDEQGQGTVQFDQPGTYHLSADRKNSNGERNIVRPYAVVEVTGDPVEKPEVDPEEKPEVDPEEKPEVDPEEKPEEQEPPFVVSGIKDKTTVKKDTVEFTIDVADGVSVFVELNGKEVAGTRAMTYTLKLKEDENHIKIRAVDSNGVESVEEFNLTYEVPKLDATEQEVLDKTIKYIIDNGVTSEWEAISLAQAGQKVPKSYGAHFSSKIENEIVNGLESGRFKITDAERLTLAALAIGKDPTNIEGINLVELIYNSPDREMWDGSIEDTMTYQGNNGLAFALIALDAGKFEVPKNAKWTREKLVDALLKAQREEGAWNLNDAFPEISFDITAMVLTSLAPYKDQPKVEDAITKAVDYLSSVQTDDGGFDGGEFVGGITSETTSQVIIALTALGIDPTSEKFTKDQNLLEHLLSFQHAEGGFYHTIGESVPNNMASEQALNALVAYEFFLAGKGSVYDFVGQEPETPEVDPEGEPEDGEGVEEEDPEEDPEEDDESNGNTGNGGSTGESSGDEESEDENSEEEENVDQDKVVENDDSEKDQTQDETTETEEHSEKDGSNKNHNKNNEEDDSSGKTESDEDEGSPLPKTATSIFNGMLFGVSLLVIGFVLLIRKRKVA